MGLKSYEGTISTDEEDSSNIKRIVEEDVEGEDSAFKRGVDGPEIQKADRTTEGVSIARIINSAPDTMRGFLPRPKFSTLYLD